MNKYRIHNMGNQQVSVNHTNLIPIPARSGYYTDGLGNILSTKQKNVKILKKRLHYGKSKNPYIKTKVGDTNALAHRIIASVHVGRPLLSTEVVNHINGVTTDNALSNLEVVDHRQNVKHAVENKLYCSGEAWYKARGLVYETSTTSRKT